MSGLMQVTVAEAQGAVAIPADLDKLCVVIGPSSLSSGFSPFFLSGAAAQAAVGYGDASDVGTQAIEQRQAGGGAGTKFPVAFYVTPGSTPGAYGVLDVSGVTGTALVTVDAAVLPFGTYTARLVVQAAGSLGATPPPTLQWALDYTPTMSNTTALPAATFTIPNSGVKFDFGHAVTGTTDITSAGLYGGGGTLDTETLILTVNGTAHTLTLSGAGNAADEATLFAAIHAQWATLTATAGGAGGVKLVLTNMPGTSIVVGAGTANAHLGLTAGTYGGTLSAGDVIKVRTTAPQPSTGDVDAAFLALANAPGDFALVALPFNCNAAMMAHITTGLDVLAARGKRCTALAQVRAPAFDLNLAISGVTNANPAVVTVASTAKLTDGATYTIAGSLGATGINGNNAIHVIDGTTFSVPVSAGGVWSAGGTVTENDAAWNVNVSNDLATYNDSRIIARAAYGLTTDAMTTRTYLRANFAQFVADVVRCDRAVWPGVPADQAEANVALSDAAGALVGHDEGARGASTGLSNDALGNRFSTEQRFPDPRRREAVFNAAPWTLYAPTDRVKNLMVRRVANAMEREAVSAGIGSLGGTVFYTPADPAVPGSQAMLTDTSRNAIHGVIYGALFQEFAGDIQNVDDGDVDTGLVQVASAVTVTGGNLVNVKVTLAPRVLGYLLSLAITLAIQE